MSAKRERIIHLIFAYILFWFFSNSDHMLSNSQVIESDLDNLIQSVFYADRKTNKISYEELNKNNFTHVDDDHNLQIELDPEFIADFENYYHNYFSQLEKEESNRKSQDHDDFNFSARQKLIEEKINFAKTLYSLYGNRTIFKIDLTDLEKLVSLNILSENNAILFWEYLLQQKTDRLRSFFGKIQHEESTEVYLFNFIPMKEIGFSFGSVVILYFFFLRPQVSPHSTLRQSFIYNLFGTLVAFCVIDTLYAWKYYVASSILFIQLIYFIKCFIDSIMLNFGFIREDFEIFSSTVGVKSGMQFNLKLMVLIILTIQVGILSIKRFNCILNYLVFYFCVFFIILLVCNSLHADVPVLFKPLKHTMFLMIGLGNFLVTKFHRRITRFSSLSFSTLLKDRATNTQVDFIYLISEVFSYFCLSYVQEYITYQIYTIDKVKNKLQPGTRINKSFTFDDSLWLIPFIFGFVLVYVAYNRNEYCLFLFTVYYFKMILEIFGKIFNYKLFRVFFSVVLFTLILLNQIISNRSDHYIFELFNLHPGTSTYVIYFIKFMVKAFGLCLILYTIFLNFDFIYTIHSEKNSEIEEMAEEAAEEILRKVEIASKFDKKRNRKVTTFQIQVVRPERVFNFWNVIYIHLDFYTNFVSVCLIFYFMKEIERNYFIIMFYTLLIFILLARVYFIINEFKNDSEYLYAFTINFFVGIRLITITRAHPFLYIVSCAYVLFLILLYCMIDRRRLLVTIFILFHLYSACLFLNSNFLFINILCLLCLPLTFSYIQNQNAKRAEDNSNNSERRGSFNFGFIFPAMVVLCFQLYGFKHLMGKLNQVNNYIIETFLMGFDIFAFCQNLVQGNYINEFQVIAKIIDLVQSL